jgi:hypothetical protein
MRRDTLLGTVHGILAAEGDKFKVVVFAAADEIAYVADCDLLR